MKFFAFSQNLSWQRHVLLTQLVPEPFRTLNAGITYVSVRQVTAHLVTLLALWDLHCNPAANHTTAICDNSDHFSTSHNIGAWVIGFYAG